jgi:hypothetical protein
VDLNWLVPVVAVGVSFVAAGVAGMVRRPASRAGALMVAVGLAWFAPAIGNIPLGIFWSLSFDFGSLFLVLLAQLFVSFPTGRLRTRWDRGVVAGAYAWYVLGNVLVALTWNPVFRQRPFEHNVFYAGPHADLREALARVLGDPSMQILYRVRGAGGSEFVDEAGRPAALPGDDAGRSVTVLDRDGTPIAALIHDPALESEPELLESAAAAARLAIDNARLQAEVRSQLREVRLPRPHRRSR